jgi:hypothetical protein
MAFKLFLWDRIEADARAFSRPDRIKTYRLEWTAPQLKTMLSRRLAAHSNGRVSSLAAVVALGRAADIDDLVVSLSGGSPRNIIRICKAIFDQQSEFDAQSKTVNERAVLAGIESIALAIAAETLPENVLRDLKKLKRADFTLTNVYADVFRITQGSGTQKVQSWQESGGCGQNRQSAGEKGQSAQQRLRSDLPNCS